MTNYELKSKAMSLGNRLAAKGQDRSAAYIRAWSIVKAGGIELPVKGVTIGTRQIALKRLSAYDPAQVRAVLVPEPANPVDKNAVAVMVGVQNGKGLYHLGYLPKEQTRAVKAMGSRPVSLRLVSGTWGWSGRTTYGARVLLAA